MSAANAFIAVLSFLVAGFLLVEIRRHRRSVIDSKGRRYFGPERRQARLIRELDPAESKLIDEVDKFIEDGKLETRDGLRMMMQMMKELYIADYRRTLKVNEVVEKVNILEKKTLLIWMEDHPKASWFFITAFLAVSFDEIRAPLVKQLFGYIGLSLP